MKKLIGLGLAALLILPAAAYAASIGGAETIGQGNLAIGIEQEVVFERKMKDSKGSMFWTGEPEEHLVTFRSTKIDKAYRTMAKISYGLSDNFDLYAKLGIALLDVTHKRTFWVWDEEEPVDPWDCLYDNGKFDGKNAFAWGLGIKGTLPLEDGWTLGLDAQYLRNRNRFNYSGIWWRRELENGPYSEVTGKGKITMYEWHIAPYIAKDMEQFIPYLGVRYSDTRSKTKGEFFYMDLGEFPTTTQTSNLKSKAKRNIGVFVGTDYKIDENWKLNIEGRFLDETAMSAGATYSF